MNLAELARIINLNMQFERNPEKITVVITTKKPYATCGSRPCTGVASAGMGFDFEDGQFRITPEESLMCIKHDVPQKVLEWRDMFLCPKCEHKLSKRKNANIKFCSNCGQAILWE